MGTGKILLNLMVYMYLGLMRRPCERLITSAYRESTMLLLIVINKKDSQLPKSHIANHSSLHHRSRETQVPLEPAISLS